jgi:hypothetical protein
MSIITNLNIEIIESYICHLFYHKVYVLVELQRYLLYWDEGSKYRAFCLCRRRLHQRKLKLYCRIHTDVHCYAYVVASELQISLTIT